MSGLGSFISSNEREAQLAEAERTVAYVRVFAVIGMALAVLGPFHLIQVGEHDQFMYPSLVIGGIHSLVLFIVARRTSRYLVLRAALGSSIDLALVTVAVHASGGVHSSFFILYCTIVVGIAMRFGLGAGLLASFCTTLVYLGSLAWDGTDLLANSDKIAVSTIGLFVTAALAGGFHRQLSARLNVLIQTRQMRDDFLMVASHELRTPLVAIRGISQVLDRVMRDGSTERALLQRVDAAIERMTRLVRDLTDAARVDAGTLTLERSTVDVVSIARAAVDEARLGNPRREVRLRFSDEFVRIEADSMRLAQVFANLLTNALKFTTPDKGPIVLEVRRENGHALATVRDRGLGIPRASLPTIFEKHARSSRTPAMGFAGLGLGLYIARAIVLAHGGSIEVESREGDGSSFTVRLPLSPEARLPSSPP